MFRSGNALPGNALPGKALAVVAACLFVAACSSSKSIDDLAKVGAPDAATMVSVAQGELVGLTTARGAKAWLGVPFAKAPAGDLRFRAPRPPEPWSGVMEATSFGHRCPQMTNGLNQSEGVAPGLRVGDEDCLRLNVFAPADGGEGLPVMVWIHGGGNVWGRASAYDPSDLVMNENVIVVTTQYRLGPLGWFASEALRDAAGASDEPLDASANFGTLDLVASLRWVRDNVAAFGGDPGNVTIFGESAGGHNVVTLLAAPQAAGLFHRAVIQSGSFDSVSVAEAENGGQDLINPSTEVMARLGAASAGDLRNLSLDELFSAFGFEENGGFLDLPKIITGDPALPTPTLREAFDDIATFNATPIITGTNRDEMKLFQALDPELVNAWLRFIIIPKDQDFYDALSDYQSRLWRVRSVDDPASRMARAGHGDVWAYRFDWDEAGKFLLTDFSTLFGAAHAFEIPFVMGNFEFLGPADRFVFAKETKESREDLSRAMQRYWAAFARTGAPGEAGGPAWRPYADGASLMRFDSRNDGGVEVVNDADSLGGLLEDLSADPRLDGGERCRIAEALVLWARDMETEIRRGAGCTSS
ncbi:MAG: carboxylesterase family protein [Alphaproteobacteria bacterium]|nr:carboxylesterase family protein [Alphaproteobacteria bacterium]